MKSKILLLAACLFSAGLIAPSGYAQNFLFHTIAGGPPGFLDGNESNAAFFELTGVAVDGAGNIYVADQGNNAIGKMAPHVTNWTVTTIAGGAPGSADGTNLDAHFFGPEAIAIDKAGNLYVSDQYNCTIRQIAPAGSSWVVSTIAGAAGIADKVDGTNSKSRFSYPAGLAVDASGNIFVADEVNNSIRKITPSGTNWVVTTIAGGSPGNNDGANAFAQFSSPSGVAVSSGGRVFVADQFNNTIRLVTPAGTNWLVSTIAGDSVSGRSDGSGTNAHFHGPVSVAVDGSDNVYVADLVNSAIRKMTLVGTNWVVTTIAGGSMGASDGTGTNASFDLPLGVATDAYGDVFVADSRNNAIRLGVSPDGIPPTGSLEVAIVPAGASSAGAEWQLDGGPSQTNGAILSSIVPGNHTVTFSMAAGFTTPAMQIVPVTARQTNLVTGNYTVAIPNAGSLLVMISPSDSVPPGAQWRVDNGIWLTNGAVVAGLVVGAHSISFDPVPGWISPSLQSVGITNGQTTLAVGIYILQTGSVEVSMFLSAVVSAGAKWQVDGGAFHPDGATLAGLLPGIHTVSFNTVLGWVTPGNQIVNVTNSLMTSAVATYARPPQLTGVALAGGNFHFVLNGPDGSNYVIQTSSNLTVWTPLSTNAVPAGGSLIITNLNVAQDPSRFFRAVGISIAPP